MPGELFSSTFELQVLTALNFYATGSYEDPVGCNWMLCLGRSTVSTFISEVTKALNEPSLQRRWIRFPHQKDFQIPGILGFIDGSEVSIISPPQDMNPQCFWTRKHQYAINVMIVSMIFMSLALTIHRKVLHIFLADV